MNKFEKPAVEVEKFDLADVIATSGEPCELDGICLMLCDGDDCSSDLGAG